MQRGTKEKTRLEARGYPFGKKFWVSGGQTTSQRCAANNQHAAWSLKSRTTCALAKNQNS
jgi:hypothetical protein